MTVKMGAFYICLAVIAVAFLAAPASAVNNGDIPVNTPASARRMVEDLTKTFGAAYPGVELLNSLDRIEAKLKQNGKDSDATAVLDKLIRRASLANPLLDFDRILVIRRTGEANRSLNSHTTDTIKRTGWDNEISELSNLRDDRFTDKWFIVDYVKQYQPNPWGLYDIIGNVSEWTRTSYRPYPYKADSRNNGSVEEKKVARGGSWADRPKNAGSAVRFEYQTHQKVYNVGFRIIIEQ